MSYSEKFLFPDYAFSTAVDSDPLLREGQDLRLGEGVWGCKESWGKGSVSAAQGELMEEKNWRCGLIIHYLPHIV